MSRKNVVVVQVPPFDVDHALGGAEVITAQLVGALSSHYRVSVLSGHHQDTPPAEPRDTAGVRTLDAFPIDDHVRSRGHIRRGFHRNAVEVLNEAHLIVSVERTLIAPPPVPRIATLGGVAYPHTLEMLRHRAWDHLVVPSPFVAGQVRDHVTDVHGLRVITNGIDTTQFRPQPSRHEPEKIKLLLPSRPVADKGFHAAVDLVAVMRETGMPAFLKCVDQPDGLDGSGVLHEARAHGVPVEIVPWVSRDRMPDLYNQADLTLCLSHVPEGFGLTAAESIACGTPVLATPAGFLRDMLPAGYGIHMIDPTSPPRTWLPVVHDALSTGRSHARTYGRPEIEARYSHERMTQQFTQLARSLLTPDGPSRNSTVRADHRPQRPNDTFL